MRPYEGLADKAGDSRIELACGKNAMRTRDVQAVYKAARGMGIRLRCDHLTARQFMRLPAWRTAGPVGTLPNERTVRRYRRVLELAGVARWDAAERRLYLLNLAVCWSGEGSQARWDAAKGCRKANNARRQAAFKARHAGLASPRGCPEVHYNRPLTKSNDSIDHKADLACSAPAPSVAAQRPAPAGGAAGPLPPGHGVKICPTLANSTGKPAPSAATPAPLAAPAPPPEKTGAPPAVAAPTPDVAEQPAQKTGGSARERALGAKLASLRRAFEARNSAPGQGDAAAAPPAADAPRPLAEMLDQVPQQPAVHGKVAGMATTGAQAMVGAMMVANAAAQPAASVEGMLQPAVDAMRRAHPPLADLRVDSLVTAGITDLNSLREAYRRVRSRPPGMARSSPSAYLVSIAQSLQRGGS